MAEASYYTEIMRTGIMKLLIADDEQLIRNGLLSLDWESIGFCEVFSAENGIEARKIILSEKIDVVVTDVRMPGLTGLELAELVKEYSLDTAVVLLTGFSDFEYARKALESNVYKYLLKPFHPRDILEAVHQVSENLKQTRYKTKIIRQYEEVSGAADTVSQIKNLFPGVSETTQRILNEMANNFEKSISQSEIAERYHFSNNYLSRKIKQDTGYSFVDILTAIRITNAAQFLSEGDRVNQACIKCGFNDQRYFSQVF